jgi:hypothetical protein
MSATIINSNCPQTTVPSADQNTNRPLKNGILEGRSVVPRKSTGWLTDMQVRKIMLTALTVILCIGPLLVGIVTGGTGGLVIGGVYSIMCGTLGGLIASLNWPKADYQTPEGAVIIRKDLETKSLATLHGYYRFSDLSDYGYISVGDAHRMQSLYDSMPHYETVNDGDRVNWYASYCVNAVNGIHERRQEIESQFDNLRNRWQTIN